VLPINSSLRAALAVAKEASLADFVVAWAGGPILSIRKGLDRATGSENLPGIGRHTLRHTAAVHMAKGEGPMSQIAEYLGHSSRATTKTTYAR
jgi:integrase